MLPNKIIIKDFMAHEYSEIDCSMFSSALIVGRLKKDGRVSNGIGKTTIFKAIDYALYNTAPCTLDDIIRDGQKKCVVIFEFYINNSLYKITRQRSASGRSEVKIEEFISNIWHDRSQKTNTDTDKEILKLIKISYKAFKHSVLFAQGDVSGLASISPQDRISVLKEPLSLSIYSKYEKKAKEEFSNLNKMLDVCSGKIESLGDPNVDIPELQKQIDELLINKSENKKLLESYNKTRESLTSQLRDLEKILNYDALKLHDELSSCKKMLNKTLSNLDYINNETLVTSQKIDENKKDLKKQESNVDKLINNKESIVINKTSSEIEISLNKVLEADVKAKTLISKLELDIKDCKTSLPNGENCPTCLQGISDVHRSNCEAEAQKNKDILVKKLNDYKNKYSKICEKKLSLKNSLVKVKQDEKELDSLTTQIANLLSSIDKDKQLIEKLSNMLLKHSNDKKKLEDELKLLKNKENELVSAITSAGDQDLINNKIIQTKNKLEDIDTDIKHAIEKSSVISKNIGIMDERLNSRKLDLDKLSVLLDEKNQLNKSIGVVQKACFAFSPFGIPSLIIKTILDDFQLEVNNLLAELRPGIQIEFYFESKDKDDLHIKFLINGMERKWDQLGGGQKVFIALSLKLGLSIIIQRRLGSDIKFLELDEVDQPLDESGVEAYANIIKKWSQKFKIFVITHNKPLQRMLNYKIVVENDGGGSYTYVE